MTLGRVGPVDIGMRVRWAGIARRRHLMSFWLLRWNQQLEHRHKMTRRRPSGNPLSIFEVKP